MLSLTSDDSQIFEAMACSCAETAALNHGKEVGLCLTALGFMNTVGVDIQVGEIRLVSIVLDDKLVKVRTHSKMFSPSNPCFRVFFATLTHWMSLDDTTTQLYP